MLVNGSAEIRSFRLVGSGCQLVRKQCQIISASRMERSCKVCL